MANQTTFSHHDEEYTITNQNPIKLTVLNKHTLLRYSGIGYMANYNFICKCLALYSPDYNFNCTYNGKTAILDFTTTSFSKYTMILTQDVSDITVLREQVNMLNEKLNDTIDILQKLDLKYTRVKKYMPWLRICNETIPSSHSMYAASTKNITTMVCTSSAITIDSEYIIISGKCKITDFLKVYNSPLHLTLACENTNDTRLNKYLYEKISMQKYRNRLQSLCLCYMDVEMYSIVKLCNLTKLTLQHCNIHNMNLITLIPSLEVLYITSDIQPPANPTFNIIILDNWV
jgi:hypothetical protein